MESEDDFDWEEVPVPEYIEITIQPSQRAELPAKKKNTGISYAERLLRIDCHKVHTIALIANARTRNKWVNDPLLHARLLSLTPMDLQNAFAMIHKSRVPDQNQRGRMFEAAVRNLTDWWASSFFDVLPEGHIRNRTYAEVHSRLVAGDIVSIPQTPSGDPSGSKSSSRDVEAALITFLTSKPFPEVDALMDLLDDDGETIKSPNSLMKHALMHCASRDTSAQLFTALCRGLGIPTRLVVSLQSVPWKTSVGRPKPKYQKKGGPKRHENQGKILAEVAEDEDEMEEVVISATSSKGGDRAKTEPEIETYSDASQHPPATSVKGKGKETAPPIKLRKQKSKGRMLNDDSRTAASLDPLLTPPVFWTEVFSRPDGRWFPVDPIRGIVNKRKVFDPTPLPSSVGAFHPSTSSRVSTPKRATAHQENRMMYVLVFEEDGYARDVTRRYAREYNTKVAKAQVGGGGKGRQLWWERVVSSITRPYRLHRDDVEDEELEIAQLTEGMPTTLAGFKDHPLYVLERHLKQNEVIHPPPPETVELGKFRGESVYPRGAVVTLKTAETWMRTEGRTVKPGCQPLKMVKLRASTVGKIREVEILREGAATGGTVGKEVMQGLYARSQTELFIPDPVVDGLVPKNSFGNVDLFVPSMLPHGAVHIPFKGIGRIARKLGFDYGEAVTGFEFKKRRAFPTIEGIVVAQENESTLLEAYWEAEQVAQERARVKREGQVIKRWVRLIQGLRIRKRLQSQYATNIPPNTQRQQEVSEKPSSDTHAAVEEKNATGLEGGFLVEADDVVQAFSLPKYQHVDLPLDPIFSKQERQKTVGNGGENNQNITAPEYMTYEAPSMDVSPAEGGTHTRAPITMQVLAEAAAKKQSAMQVTNDVEGTRNALPGVETPNTKALRSQQKPSRQGVSTRTKVGKRTTLAIKGRGGPKIRGKHRSSRKRRHSSDDEEGCIDVDESSASVDDSEEAHSGDDDQPSPKKRARTLASISSTAARSGRVLRPRKGKVETHIEEDQI